MTTPQQLNMFAELEPPAPKKPPPGSYVAPEEVRPKLQQVLAQARAATAIPWDARQTQYWRTVFPQMCNWLPPEERDRMRAEFAAEMKRLDEA
jgi:hypothetical protein